MGRRARAALPQVAGRCPGRAVAVPGASRRSTVEQVALADGGGVARTRTGGDAGGSSRRCAGHHGDGGGPPRPAAARLRARRADEVRARRGDVPRRCTARTDMGSPVAVMVGNTEWPKWEKVMAADPVDPDELAALARNAPLTRPRPGHADLAGMQKYGLDEARPILERASARETAARVALGAVARSYLKETAGIEIVSHVVELAAAKAPYGVVPDPRRRREAGRRPGALPGRRRVEGDGRGDRPGPQGRRHPRRSRRGARLRRPRRPRLARPLGPPARRPARGRAHGHPGHQGRRGRRRLRPGPGAGLEGARRDRAHRGRDPSLDRPLRRHRGRHVHR